MIIILVMAAVGGLLGGALWLLLHRKKLEAMPPTVRMEFWVYGNAENRPSDKEIMDQLISENPHHKKGVPPVGAAEGMTFSDVRFHLGVLKRAKNAMLFRPEIFSELDAEIPATLPALIADSPAIFVVRFISQSPERRRTYLQFLTYVAEAIAKITGAKIIWDTETQKFFTYEDLFQALDEDNEASRFDLQVVVHWTETPYEGRAFTRGMAKVGLPDIEFDHQPLDQKTLAMYLVREAARCCWNAGNLDRCDITDYGEVFEVDFSQPRVGNPTHRGWLTTLHAVRKRQIGA